MVTREKIDLASVLSSLSEGRLTPREDCSEAAWRFWERRNLNLHRVVGLWIPGRRVEALELHAEARSAIGRHFKRAWWRGLAFGVVVEVPEIHLSPANVQELIDVRENSRGTWQWVVLVSGASHAAVGVHTWSEGYLSPVYRNLLGHLQACQHEVASVSRGKDGLLKALTAARPRAFPEFRNISQ